MKSFIYLTMILFFYSFTNITRENEHAKNAICSDSIPTYDRHISLILNESCAKSGCHTTNSSKGEIDLSNYASASTQFKTNPKNLSSVHHDTGADAMPLNSVKLSDEVLKQLDCWVKNGCPQ